MFERTFEEAVLLMIPKPCPYKFIRFGGDGDGAYLIPDDLVGIDACFSPGVSNYKFFEDDLSKVGIKSYMCDFSIEVEDLTTPLVENMQFFEKKWLDVWGTIDSISLDDWVRKYSPDERKDLILQMDIEGAEYRNLYYTNKSTLNRFRIISIEFHHTNYPYGNEFKTILQKLDETHYCVYVHPNNCCGCFIEEKTGLNIPHVVELTYLRKDRFIGNPNNFYKAKLPHPLDIINAPNIFPLFLNEKWNLFASIFGGI
jgi:hypothetical protein